MPIDFSDLAVPRPDQYAGTQAIEDMRGAAPEALSTIDAREGLGTTRVESLNMGMWNGVYRLLPANIVAKLSVGPNDFEVNFLRTARALDVPVPAVLATGTLALPKVDHVTYFLMPHLDHTVNPAQVLAEGRLPDAARLALAHDLGTDLARLHRKPLGYVTFLGTRVADWQAALTHPIFRPDWTNPRPNALFDADLLAIFQNYLERAGYWQFQQGTLVHGDLNLNNTLVDATTLRLRAVIDPAGFAGMPMFDLAYACMPLEYGFDYLDTMVAAYQAAGGTFEPRFFWLSILVVLYQHRRFHTPEIRQVIESRILPALRQAFGNICRYTQ
jgi:aminoglycoside phosphotransferase (APT) family kinase protein